MASTELGKRESSRKRKATENPNTEEDEDCARRNHRKSAKPAPSSEAAPLPVQDWKPERHRKLLASFSNALVNDAAAQGFQVFGKSQPVSLSDKTGADGMRYSRSKGHELVEECFGPSFAKGGAHFMADFFSVAAAFFNGLLRANGKEEHFVTYEMMRGELEQGQFILHEESDRGSVLIRAAKTGTATGAHKINSVLMQRIFAAAGLGYEALHEYTKQGSVVLNEEDLKKSGKQTKGGRKPGQKNGQKSGQKNVRPPPAVETEVAVEPEAAVEEDDSGYNTDGWDAGEELVPYEVPKELLPPTVEEERDAALRELAAMKEKLEQLQEKNNLLALQSRRDAEKNQREMKLMEAKLAEKEKERVIAENERVQLQLERNFLPSMLGGCFGDDDCCAAQSQDVDVDIPMASLDGEGVVFPADDFLLSMNFNPEAVFPS